MAPTDELGEVASAAPTVAGTSDPSAGNTASDSGQRYEIYGEYVEVEDHDGSMATIERPYPEPIIASELKPNQRGNLLPE